MASGRMQIKSEAISRGSREEISKNPMFFFFFFCEGGVCGAGGHRTLGFANERGVPTSELHPPSEADALIWMPNCSLLDPSQARTGGLAATMQTTHF